MPPDMDATFVQPNNPPVDLPVGYLFIQRPYVMFGRYFVIRGNVIIGGDEVCDVRLEGGSVKPRHARINLEFDRDRRELTFGLYDLGENTVQVNGQPIKNRAVLAEHDRIDIGNYIFTFRMLP